MPYKDPEVQKANIRRLQNGKRDKMRALKESTPCADCGKYYRYYVMHFDHLGDKKFNISYRSASYGSALLADEIEKCEIVCANCHAERTYQRAAVAKVVKAPA